MKNCDIEQELTKISQREEKILRIVKGQKKERSLDDTRKEIVRAQIRFQDDESTEFYREISIDITYLG